MEAFRPLGVYRGATMNSHLSARPLEAAPLEDDAGLLEIRRKFSSSTYHAARLLRRTGHPRFLPAIVGGVLERYVEPVQAAGLRSGGEGLRLCEDLGLDSLSLTEI